MCLLSAGTAAAGSQQPDAATLDRVEVAGKKAELSSWLRAESQHFIVYSDTREEDVTPLLENLEKLEPELTPGGLRPALQSPEDVCAHDLGMANRNAVPVSRLQRRR